MKTPAMITGMLLFMVQSVMAQETVAFWDFNEASGTTASDGSGNSHTITLNGGSNWDPGVLCFDGIDDWGSVPDNESFTFDNALTVRARVKPNTTTGILTIIRHHHQTGETEGWYLRISSGRIDGAVKMDNNIYQVTGTQNLATTEYSDLAMVWSNNVITLYVNGQPDGSKTTSGTGVNSTADITVGRLSNVFDGEYFDGCIDFITVLNYASPPLSPNSTIAMWDFNEESGTTASDGSGNSHTITFNGGSNWDPGVLCFDGIDDWGSVPDNESFTFDNALTVRARVKPNTTTGILTIIRHHHQTGETEGWYLRISSGRIDGAVKMDNNIIQVTGIQNLSTTEYSDLAMVWSNDSLTLYINGQADGSMATSGTGINSRADVTVGRLSNAFDGEYFDGCIDKISVYNYYEESLLGVRDKNKHLISRFKLHQNYPNPFNPETKIGLALPKATHISLVVYDIWGREVSRLIDGYLDPGYHRVIWDGKATNGIEASSGIYLARMITPEFASSIKLVLIK